ncbi:myopalladin isoform X2 [Oncorhynchus tshawytscha]|uniref:myopalladin isoform X2 n=1 Tax=Oncorhynchus tshawytscha TaxID=74940 RepID=UPI0016346079|nr:myopalladin isoform X2 [Oncorhynchus tshawytscha]
MQEDNVNQHTSLSQLLRENYLAEARARHSGMSRSDSSRHLVYAPLKGKAEDSAGQDKPQPQFPDLSAFLSQEELDKSVNLACQAIGHKACEERTEFKAPVTPSVTSTASNTPDTQPDLELKEPLPTHVTFFPERRSFSPLSIPNNVIRIDKQIYQPSQLSIQDNAIRTDRQKYPLSQPSIQDNDTRTDRELYPPSIQDNDTRTDRELYPPSIQDNGMRTDRQTFPPSIIQDITMNNWVAREAFEDFKRSGARGINTPEYGLGTQSKKEFLNKAADFIEELSSLFKANSSKRIWPRSCKTHRSRANKGQVDGSVYSLNADNRERTILLQDFETEMEMERPTNPFSIQPSEVQGLGMDPGFGHAYFPMQDRRTTEEQYDEAESPALVEITPGVYTADPICEPPHFIQKLKSREVLEGSKVQLDCIVRGLPMPEVRWFCEGKELENCPDIQIINNRELHSLTIAEAFEEDTGRYSCFASNFYGTGSTSAEIYVEGASSTDSEGEQHSELAQLQRTRAQPGAQSLPPVVSVVSLCVDDATICTEEQPQEATSLPSSQVVTASVPVQVATNVLPVTEVTTAPSTQVAFTLVPAQEMSAQLLVQEVSTLDLPPVDTVSVLSLPTPSRVPVTSTPLPTQTVSTTALPLTQVVSSTLPAQVAAVQTTLAENLNGDSYTLSPDIYPQGLDGRPIIAAPVFTKSLQDLLASESELVVLECRVKGVPSPKVDWYREGTVIEDSPDFRILQKKPRSMDESEEICTLVIAEVFPEDSGKFTCTASNKYGTVSSIAALRVKGNENTNNNHVKTLVGTLTMESTQVPEPSSSDLTLPRLKPQAEALVTNSIKPHSSTIRLDPFSSSNLRLEPLSTSTLRLDPLNSSMLRQVPISPNMPSLDPLSLGSSLRIGTRSSNTYHLDPLYLSTPHPDLPTSSSGLCQDPQSSGEMPKTDQGDSRAFSVLPDPPVGLWPKVAGTPIHKPEPPPHVNLPDPPNSSCLKPGVLVNHNGPRSSSRAGLRVHFKLPEDETENQSEASNSHSYEDMSQLANKEPPPVLAKPKLDPVQLQLLHNQVLMEQQQTETEPNGATKSQPEASAWPAQTHHESQAQTQAQPQSNLPRSSTPMLLQTTHAAPILTTAPTPFLNSAPVTSLNTTPTPQLNTSPPAHLLNIASAPLLNPYTTHSYSTSSPLLNTSPVPPKNTTSATLLNTAPPAPVMGTLLSLPQLKTAPSCKSSPPSASLLRTVPAPHLYTSPASPPYMTQQNTTHSSQLNLTHSSLPKAIHVPKFSTPPTPHLNTAPTASLSSIPVDFKKAPTTMQNTSPTPLLRTTHASLLNLAPTSQSFNYSRPKEFITAQTPLSPFRSPSPTESPVPLLHKLAAELNSSNPNQFSPQPRVLPTRVLKSPTSPPSFMSSPNSPTMLPAAYLNSVFALPQQSPPQAASPTSSTSSPIQNHVAFLSSVLPSLHTTQATNSMGLPRSAHRPLQGILKKLPTSTRPILDDDIRSSQQTLLHDIEKKLRFNEGLMRGHVQQEYKVSNFEQRLMSEIEFRLERTPVEESDDEVQHDEIPTGKCIAPMFGKKLKNFRAMEGVPMTFSCKVVGIPVPKVYWFKDGKQILRKNYHYKKIREGDGTCALHIEVTNNDDDGNYTVLAANPQGRISCSGHLIIQTGPLRNRMTPMIHSQRVRARIQEVEEGEPTQERFFQPHFLQAPGDMVAHEGRVCRLDCKVSGLPNPELMWLINGRPIYPNFYHRMLVRENGIHSLVIDPLKQDDAGTYTCIASNKAGQSSFSLELRVVEKEMKQVPQFVEKLQNTGIAEGTPVRLECRVLGMPPPVIYWKKDNDTIPHTKARVSLHQDATGYVFLLIQPTRKEDAGWYTVSAKNKAGIVSCTARLDIYAQWHQHVPLPMKKAPW